MKKHITLYSLSLIAVLITSISYPAALAEQASTRQPTTASQSTAASPTSTATPSPIPPKAMMEQYQDVLLGKQSYIQCNTYDAVTTETLMPSQIYEWYGYQFDIPQRYVSFCITDLDADGSPEIILKLSSDFGYELLRYENGAVYGFPFVARAMIDITLNGDIYGSSGAADNSWYQIRFHEGQYTLTDTCRMQSTETGGVQYYIGDKEVSQSEYETFTNGFADKTRPTWIEFSVENFADDISRFE